MPRVHTQRRTPLTSPRSESYVTVGGRSVGRRQEKRKREKRQQQNERKRDLKERESEWWAGSLFKSPPKTNLDHSRSGPLNVSAQWRRNALCPLHNVGDERSRTNGPKDCGRSGGHVLETRDISRDRRVIQRAKRAAVWGCGGGKWRGLSAISS